MHKGIFHGPFSAFGYWLMRVRCNELLHPLWFNEGHFPINYKQLERKVEKGRFDLVVALNNPGTLLLQDLWLAGIIIPLLVCLSGRISVTSSQNILIKHHSSYFVSLTCIEILNTFIKTHHVNSPSRLLWFFQSFTPVSHVIQEQICLLVFWATIFISQF